jgi:hypothetical protein
MDREINIETDVPEMVIEAIKSSGMNYFTYQWDDDSVSISLTPKQEDAYGGDWEDELMKWEEEGLIFSWGWTQA